MSFCVAVTPSRHRIFNLVQPDRNYFLPGRLIRAGYFKDEIAVLVGGATDEQASPVEQLDLGFKYGPFLLDHLQSDVGPAATDFMGGDFQAAITGKRHHTRLTQAQVETFTAQQAVGGVVEHGLQLADVPFQLRIDHSVISCGEDGIHADAAGVFGHERIWVAVPAEHQEDNQQQAVAFKPHFVHFPRLSLQYTRGWFVGFREFQKS